MLNVTINKTEGRLVAALIGDLDNVATVFSNEAKAGSDVEVRDKKGNSQLWSQVDPQGSE